MQISAYENTLEPKNLHTPCPKWFLNDEQVVQEDNLQFILL